MEREAKGVDNLELIKVDKFRRKGCGYSPWWLTIKAKFFVCLVDVDVDVVTCDVDRDVSTAYC